MVGRDVHYARNGDVSIAYQMFGSGPSTLVYVPGFLSNLEGNWLHPQIAAFLRRLGSFARVVAIDRRGSGLSDRPIGERPPSLEEQMDDLDAVMGAAGVRPTTLLGCEDGAGLCLLYAASHPENVSRLIVYGALPAVLRDERTPWSLWDKDRWESYLHDVRDGWGTRAFAEQDLRWAAPSVALDEDAVYEHARYLRLAASPAAAAASIRLYGEMDLRDVLPVVNVPTLVLHRTGNPEYPIEAARYVAETIPRSRLVELEGPDFLWYFGDVDALVAEIEEFLTGSKHAVEPDRVLATVLFTDIVGSTERAARIGDRRWRELLGEHDARIRRQLDLFRGREIDTAGDGFLAVFDGPARAVRCAQAIAAAIREIGLEIRAGCHTGEVELVGDVVRGIAVHIGARVSALAGPDEVLVSSTVKDLVAGSGLTFADAGHHKLKGVPDDWHLYRASGADLKPSTVGA
jgi:class 3 adenylate cyclase